MEEVAIMIHEKDCANVGKLDILVNNVGTNIRKPTIEYTEEELDFILRTNFKSMFELTKLCHPYLKREKVEGQSYCAQTSSVVNIGSVAGVVCMKSGTPYASTKSAMNQVSEWSTRDVEEYDSISFSSSSSSSLSEYSESAHALFLTLTLGDW
jgi:NAD(P)-dependent dehydrogenase (short-subunit alcohol dehydrogenase family)